MSPRSNHAENPPAKVSSKDEFVEYSKTRIQNRVERKAVQPRVVRFRPAFLLLYELLRFIGDFANWDNSANPVFQKSAGNLGLESSSPFVRLAQPIETKQWSWLRGVDLNHRPLGYEPNELPDCSTPHKNHISGVEQGQTEERLVVG